MEYPIRINRYLALKKICSRREADVLIKEGKVRINNQPAKLGDLVHPEDRVKVTATQKKLVYYALNKPRGVVTHSPQEGEVSIGDVIKFPTKVFPVGRLDKDSTGLIIMTNDGRLTDKLLNPEHDHEKEYEVRVDKPLSENFIRKISSGVKLDDGYLTKKCQARKKGESSFFIILTEGKKRQIRRMCLALGYRVIDLNRVRIMNVKLQGLGSKQYRKIEGKEREIFLKSLDLM